MEHQFIVSASPRHKELPLGITPLSPPRRRSADLTGAARGTHAMREPAAAGKVKAGCIDEPSRPVGAAAKTAKCLCTQTGDGHFRRPRFFHAPRGHNAAGDFIAIVP
jgi:hypothetical protein